MKRIMRKTITINLLTLSATLALISIQGRVDAMNGKGGAPALPPSAHRFPAQTNRRRPSASKPQQANHRPNAAQQTAKYSAAKPTPQPPPSARIPQQTAKPPVAQKKLPTPPPPSARKPQPTANPPIVQKKAPAPPSARPQQANRPPNGAPKKTATPSAKLTPPPAEKPVTVAVFEPPVETPKPPEPGKAFEQKTPEPTILPKPSAPKPPLEGTGAQKVQPPPCAQSEIVEERMVESIANEASLILMPAVISADIVQFRDNFGNFLRNPELQNLVKIEIEFEEAHSSIVREVGKDASLLDWEQAQNWVLQLSSLLCEIDPEACTASLAGVISSLDNLLVNVPVLVAANLPPTAVEDRRSPSAQSARVALPPAESVVMEKQGGRNWCWLASIQYLLRRNADQAWNQNMNSSQMEILGLVIQKEGGGYRLEYGEDGERYDNPGNIKGNPEAILEILDRLFGRGTGKSVSACCNNPQNAQYLRAFLQKILNVYGRPVMHRLEGVPHYVVLTGISQDGKTLTYKDPSYGNRTFQKSFTELFVTGRQLDFYYLDFLPGPLLQVFF